MYDLLPIHTRHLFPGPLTLRVGEPIDTTGMTVRQTDELTERLRAAIEAMRIPSEAMKRAADLAEPMYDDPATSGEEYWETMIDAALTETTPA